MKQVALILILILFVSIANTWADEFESPVLHPYNMDSIYRQEAKQHIEYVQKNWKIYNIGTRSLMQIEQKIKAEYQTGKLNYSVGLKFDHLNPCITARIQFFNKPIYFSFSITD